MTQPNLKIIYEHGEPFPHIEVSVDGKPVIAESIDIHLDHTGAKAVITIYDIKLGYVGPVEVVVKPLPSEADGKVMKNILDWIQNWWNNREPCGCRSCAPFRAAWLEILNA